MNRHDTYKRAAELAAIAIVLIILFALCQAALIVTRGAETGATRACKTRQVADVDETRFVNMERK